MTVKLNAHESAMLLMQMAVNELCKLTDLRSQLAVIRLRAAIEAMKGNLDVEAYEAKVLEK